MLRVYKKTGQARDEGVSINVVKVRLIPRRELDYVVKTKKGERPSGELIEISLYKVFRFVEDTPSIARQDI